MCCLGRVTHSAALTSEIMMTLTEEQAELLLHRNGYSLLVIGVVGVADSRPESGIES